MIYTSHDDSIHQATAAKPNGKLCLSIDMDDGTLGHMIANSQGGRLMVDDEQAYQLSMVLLQHLAERSSVGSMHALFRLGMLFGETSKVCEAIHCNEQTPPADGNSK